MLKEEVKKRATLFRTNTLAKTSEDDRKSLASFTHPINTIPETLIREGTIVGYIEVHIHGGISLRDIKRFIIDVEEVRFQPTAGEGIVRLGAVIESLDGDVYVISEGHLRQIQSTDIQSLRVGRVPNQ